jgi:hypothetical protein
LGLGIGNAFALQAYLLAFGRFEGLIASVVHGDGRGPLDAEVCRLQGDDDEEYDDRRKSH